MRRLASLATLGIALVVPAAAGAWQIAPSRPAAALVRLREARTLLDRGEFASARDAFAESLARSATLSAPERAAAYFGRGVAAQELLRAGADGGAAPVPYDSVLADYRSARQLDSAAYFAVAGYNAALVQRALGAHAEAARLFVEVAAVEPPARQARTLVRAARALEADGSVAARDRARQLYRAALRADSTVPEAQLALAGVAPSGGVRAWTVASLRTVLRDTTQAPAVADAALAALRRVEAPVAEPLADSLLHLFADANVSARVSPELFALGQRQQLLDAAASHPTLRDGAAAVLAAYALPAADSAALPFARSAWWSAAPDRRRSWSRVLRTVGEWHERDGRDLAATRLFEAALGLPGDRVAEWADLSAVLPLVLLYDRAAPTSPGAQRSLDRVIGAVFEGKGAAYARGELARIREFHITLGAYYAGRGQWEGTPRGAIFQLENMRVMTRRLGGSTAGVVDPAALLERLMEGYVATGRLAQARSLLPELEAANRAAGRADTSALWRGRLGATAPSGDGSQ